MKKFYTLLLMTMLSLTAFSQASENTQILNGGFEDWGVDAGKSSSSAAEPRYWHSFSSASGAFAALAGSHCFKSTDAHSGNYSAMMKASSVLGNIANGTMTTGRLNAGAMTADNTKNHSELDMSKTATDRNGDPFYQKMESRPDSVVFWVKFSTGKSGTKANMSAFITDGTYYQVPEDKTYNNIVGKAENPNIEACSEWKRISVPFTYADNGLEPKAILLTFSTCATPGGGKGDEVLLVDDVELIYKSSVTPDDPDNPDTPVTPDDPDNPDDPDTPDTPDTPEEPGISYTDELVVKVNTTEGTESTTIPNSTIKITQKEDGSYKLSIKDFKLTEDIALGDVVADNLTGVTDGEYTTIKVDQVPVSIGNKDFAAALGELKVNIDAKFTAEKLYALIDIDLTALLGQMVNVVFGTDFVDTGVKGIPAAAKAVEGEWYNLNGQRVSRPAAPGLYIVNGKKVIIK